MEKRRLIDTELLSDKLPDIGSSRQRVNATELACEIERFAHDRLGEALFVEVIGSTDKQAYISVEYTACLIRQIVRRTAVYDQRHIKIEFGSRMTVSFELGDECNSSTMNEIIWLARLAGFTLSKSGKRLLLSAGLDLPELLKFNAISSSAIVESLELWVFK